MATILVKKGAGTPSPDSLQEAELALDVVGGALYSKLADGTVVQLNDGADGGVGSSVHIGDLPPADPEEGQQWMEVPASGDAVMWIYDGDKWLQQPSSGGSVGSVDLSDYYTKEESDAAYQSKGNYSDATHTHPEYALDSRFVVCTQAEYDALTPDADTLYFIV